MKSNKKENSNNSVQDFNTVINVLDSILEKSNDFAQHMDTEINILVGIPWQFLFFRHLYFKMKEEKSLYPF
ncbi:MAG: hypothetical protein COX36_01930 [Candidatus Nealsonbacteria bacterium CG23_combo_of_CG06-09_8_20_14_all_38_19]|uniref:Uncharacterized protein n=1 Tax=Candidatus Nealsonbacteria bacterium CG23_combo_of_CG06-09_8_20_14_all_38_19 TaxID=1974721 RepID=A0A2G9YWW6_9BACT|nr:MAG: hypothetical protein COX36_01930 [Candidatus Nealsonbacteria bacterium CG23_combo_of_CG06-09_8_20_14_all_38_19]